MTIYPGPEKQDIHIVLLTPAGERTFTRPWGGPPDYAARWAMHHSLDLIRTLERTPHAPNL